jgi:hypothetical protein
MSVLRGPPSVRTANKLLVFELTQEQAAVEQDRDACVPCAVGLLGSFSVLWA